MLWGSQKRKGKKQNKPWRLTYTCNLGFKQIASAARPVEASQEVSGMIQAGDN